MISTGMTPFHQSVALFGFFEKCPVMYKTIPTLANSPGMTVIGKLL